MFSRLHDTFTHPQWNSLPKDTSADPEILADGKVAGLWKKGKKGEKKTSQVISLPDALCPSPLLFFPFPSTSAPTAQTLAHLTVYEMWLVYHLCGCVFIQECIGCLSLKDFSSFTLKIIAVFLWQ